MANIFPRWTNYTPLKLAVCGLFVGAGLVAAFSYYATPKAQRVGYMPSQPVPYSHELHVNQLGLDCRYCHSFVESSGHANIPSSNTCWNCHQHVAKGSAKLTPLYDAMGKKYDAETNQLIELEGEERKRIKPIEWVRVHQAPDYVYFNHSAHVNRGISCESCHGKVNEMEVVYQAESHSMGWCLECHRAPENHLRPLEEVFNLDYDVEEYLAAHPIKDADGNAITNQKDFGLLLKDHWNIKPKEGCTTCHR